MKTTDMKLPKAAVQKGSAKPSVKMRHIKLAGRSAFPPGPAAFSDPGSAGGDGGQAFAGPVSGAAGPGDAGE